MGFYIVVLYCFVFGLVLIAVDLHGHVFCHQSRIYKWKAYIMHAMISNLYSSKFLFSSDIVPETIRQHNNNNQALGLVFLSPHPYL